MLFDESLLLVHKGNFEYKKRGRLFAPSWLWYLLFNVLRFA